MVMPIIRRLSGTPEAFFILRVQEIVYLCGNVSVFLTKSADRSDGVCPACTAVVVCCPCGIHSFLLIGYYYIHHDQRYDSSS